MKKFISLCMIVKNEEKVIERCLSSVSPLVDEVIIVDTGSNDSTKELAGKFTSNIYDFTWINDFSAARNYAASKANGEWILVLDADEFVDEENFKQFKQELKDNKGEFDAYSAKILNFTGAFGESLVQNYHDRIYKNNGEILYYRSIHEQLKNKIDLKLKIKPSSLLIFHSGYLNQTVSEKDKRQRNKELIDYEITNGSNNPFDYFNLGNEYCSIGEYSKALDSYLKAYRGKQDILMSWVPTTLVQIIICLMHLKRYNDALAVIKDAEEIYIGSPEIPFLKGEIYYLRGQLDDAKEAFLRLVNNTDQFNHIILRPDLKDQTPNVRLGEINIFEENYSGAIYHYSSVLNINKYNEQAISKIIYILNKFHSNKEITQFLLSNKLINEKNIQNYVKECLNVGNVELAIEILNNQPYEHQLLNKVCLLKSLCINNEGSFPSKDLQDILEGTVLRDLLKSKWVNIVDLFLLREYIKEDPNVSNLLKQFQNDEFFIFLTNLLDYHHVDSIEGDLFVFALSTLLTYRLYPLCSEMLKYVDQLDQESLAKVATLLFSHDFKAESLEFYEKVEWGYLKEQDLINIINSLIQTNSKDNVIEIAKYAIIMFEQDFRFYKYILENTNDAEVLEDTLQKAKTIFGDSNYLRKI
ncbi:glycosyltransferase [Metabacillus litoralis]|uniref:glycosyltransferase n=1 Tax=Metabacillus litoralis TaxID=152268 RepID=UPI00203AEF5C|nr:TPR domain-containing glycosyltransferase [Metabacillus litoralis]MCM3410145.1 glycosyltransferase [Metabacillus litoralis]